MVATGLFLGITTGGFPAYAPEVAQIALVIAMTFSMTEISFARISPRAEARSIALSFVMSYVVLSGLLLVFAMLSADPAIRAGWVLTAAVPPAVAVIPITSLLKGDTRRSLIALAFQYLVGLALVPAIIFAFVGREVPVGTLVFQTVLLLGLPIVLSRALRHWPRSTEVRPATVSVSFLFLVTAISGSTRATLFGSPDLVVLGALSLARTFGLGLALLVVARFLGGSREAQIAATTFASFKNLGLTIVLASTVVEPAAALPSIVSLVFEILWLGALPFVFRGSPRPSSVA